MFLGNKVNRHIISGKTANFNAKILNLVIFFRSSEFFFCESSDFCVEACGSTARERWRGTLMVRISVATAVFFFTRSGVFLFLSGVLLKISFFLTLVKF